MKTNFTNHRGSPSQLRKLTGGGLLILFLFLASCTNQTPDTGWDNSRLRGSPEPPPPFVAVRIFPDVTLHEPIALKQEPGTDDFLLLQIDDREDRDRRHGSLKRISSSGETEASETLLELSGLVYSIGFHPEYLGNGYIYIGMAGPGPDGTVHSQIRRYTVDVAGSGSIDAESLVTIIEWPSNGHNGAATCFGNDGMLYVTSGDGTNLMDLDVVGQDLTTLLSKVLRLDVDGAADGQPYKVPPDNPFVGMPDIRPETWAYGLRNPWRITSDPVSGQIWVGTNGQDLRESAHLLERGANYGWSAYEGSRLFFKDRLQGPSPFTPPTIEHDHSEFRSLTGGIVYRGSRFPELEGAYIYGDYTTGRIWAAKHDGAQLLWKRELVDTNLAVADFTTTLQGDILVVDHLGHAIYSLEPAPPNPATAADFPNTLSRTGLFSSTTKLTPAKGVLPYEINAPSWHDGADSKFLLALPGTLKATFVDPESSNAHWTTWDLPDGAVLAQTLFEPDSNLRLETRILLKQQSDWAAYSYVWEKDQKDATLAPKAGTRLQTETREWQVPSRAECLVCHSRQAKFALSLTNAQLNRPLTQSGPPKNQLAALVELGVVETAEESSHTLPNTFSSIPPLPSPYDKSVDLAQRMHSYFAVNCSHCHTPNGGGNARLNLGAWVQPEDQHLLDAAPEHDTFGIVDARLIAPGDPGRSVLPVRMVRRGPGQMPPLGTLYPDTEGIKLLMDWQLSLQE